MDPNFIIQLVKESAMATPKPINPTRMNKVQGAPMPTTKRRATSATMQDQIKTKGKPTGPKLPKTKVNIPA